MVTRAGEDRQNSGQNTGQQRGRSRRQFLGMVAAAAGSSALLSSMVGAAPAAAAPPWEGMAELPDDIGTGQSVLVIGAGIAGLGAALQLRQLGFDVRILEAQHRAGGRNFTARNGTEVREVSEAGEVIQTCAFDEGLYINLGPGRIPYHHRRVLAGCQRLGVALEPYVMETTANVFGSGIWGGPQPNRRVANDTRGHLAHLLLRAINKGALAAELRHLSLAQRKLLTGLLVGFGDLKLVDNAYTYVGSTRCGDRYPLSVWQPPEAPPPLPLGELLAARFWEHRFYQPLDHLWQATMFQPVGGMDRIVEGFTAVLSDVITYNAPVTGIELVPDGVVVTWDGGGEPVSELADHCLSSIPLPVLNGLDLVGFSADYRDAIGLIEFEPACKVGWQANDRFWESDENQIYGGISWTDHTIFQVWYPSNDYFSGRGTLTGCYNFGEEADKFGELSLQERLDTARAGGARLHPEFEDLSIVPDDKGLSIAWQHVPYQNGGFAHWDPANSDAAFAYSTLLAPDGHFHVIGDQVSSLPGWQEGALMSAEYVVKQLLGLERSDRPVIRRVPDSKALRP